MNLLLLSWNIGALGEFLTTHTGKTPEQTLIGYIDDATAPWADQPFTAIERDRLTALGYRLTRITAGSFTDTAEFDAALGEVDAVYVAGGHTFALLKALQGNGTGNVLARRVRDGLPYVGTSAGSVVVGPTIEPVSLMDDPSEVPGLTDPTGLGLVPTVVIPHADGAISLYPSELIARIVDTYGAQFPLTLLHDDQALVVDDDSATIIPSPEV